jgi:hypothetical protein
LTACSIENLQNINSNPVSSISEKDRLSIFSVKEILSVAQEIATNIAASPKHGDSNGTH